MCCGCKSCNMLCTNQTARLWVFFSEPPEFPQSMDPSMQLGTSPPSFKAGKCIFMALVFFYAKYQICLVYGIMYMHTMFISYTDTMHKQNSRTLSYCGWFIRTYCGNSPSQLGTSPPSFTAGKYIFMALVFLCQIPVAYGSDSASCTRTQCLFPAE